VPILITLGAAALYLPGLEHAQAAPLRDEMYFAVTAHSVATTGRDPAGHLLPVYFPIGPVERPLMWFQPLLMYLIAGLLKVLPFSVQTIRLPMALLGVLDVVLTYAVAKSIVKRESPSIAAAVMMALTPAHLLFSRTATDYLLPVPFILGWLWCLRRYDETGRERVLLGGALLLGVGVYSLIASYFLMPFYALLTGAVLWWRGAPLRRYGLVAAGVIGPMLAGALFVALHPGVIGEVLARYDPSQETGAFVVRRLHNLWVFRSFWDLELLAINSGQMLTGVGGVFLIPTIGVALLGVSRAVVEREPIALVLVAGLIAAPLPASLIDEPGAIRRVLAMLPFVMVLAAYGIDWIASAAFVTRRVAFVAAFLFVAYVSIRYRPQLPLAQAYVRAATLPLMVLAIGVLLDLAGAARRGRRWRSAAAIGLISLLFVYFYMDFLFVRRAGVVPATVIAWGYRALCAAGIGILGVSLTAAGRWPQFVRAPGINLALFALTVGYFFIDRSTAFGPRYAHVAVIAAGTIALGSQLRRRIAGGRLMNAAAAGLLAIGALQFAMFERDYLGDYRIRRASEAEGSVLIAMDAVLDRQEIDNVPAIYLAAPLERPDVRDQFWAFALIKHRRPELAQRTVSEPARDIDFAHAAALPPNSLAIAGTSPAAAMVIERLIAEGVMTSEARIVAADGVPIASVLRRR
jgi:4-amino-4-deoxy-L-arabinose transferase-like glycosyltransferase